jgi:hypothetical protein
MIENAEPAARRRVVNRKQMPACLERSGGGKAVLAQRLPDLLGRRCHSRNSPGVHQKSGPAGPTVNGGIARPSRSATPSVRPRASALPAFHCLD